MKYFIITLNLLLTIFLNFLYINKKKNFQNKLNLYSIKKGYYISRLSNCISCHTNKGGKQFTGGLPIKTNFGKIYTPNITNNKLNIKNFIKLIKLGINSNLNFLYPIFPYLNYFKIKTKDIKSLYIFIKSLKSIKIPNKNSNLIVPYKYKKLLLLWRFLFFKKNKYKKMYIYNNFKRSNYIIKTLGHCNMCHTKLNFLGSNINYLNYLGNSRLKWSPPSLLNIKKENINKIINILKFGFNKTKVILGSMIEVINNSLFYSNLIDIKNISFYIKKLLKKKYYSDNYFKINKLNYKRGKLMYKENCIKCHGKIKISKNFIPIINKNFKIYNVNKPFLINNNYYFNSNIMPRFLINKTFNIKIYLYCIKNLLK